MNGASNRQLKTDETGRKMEFFFPKENPPVTITARSREEAERKLAARNKKEHD